METSFNQGLISNVTPDMSSAINATQQASIWDTVKANLSGSNNLDTLQVHTQYKADEALVSENKSLMLADAKLKENLAKQQKFLDISKANFQAQDLIDKSEHLSDTERASLFKDTYINNLQGFKNGSLSEDYTKSFNNFLMPHLEQANKGRQKEFDNAAITKGSDILSTLSNSEKIDYLQHLKDTGVSSDVIPKIEMFSDSKIINNSINNLSKLIDKVPLDDTSMPNLLTTSKGLIEGKIEDLKQRLVEAGGDNSSDPMIKTLLATTKEHLNNLNKIAVDRSQLIVASKFGDKTNLNTSYNGDLDYDTLLLSKNGDKSAALAELDKYNKGKDINDNAKIMFNNIEQYTPSEIADMKTKSPAFSAALAPLITSKIFESIKNNDPATTNTLILNNPEIAHNVIGKNLISLYNNSVDVSKGTPEEIAAKKADLNSVFKTMGDLAENTQGVSSLKALLGSNYDTMKNVKNISTYITNDPLTAVSMYNKVLDKGLNKNINPEIYKDIQKQIADLPERDEVLNSLFVLNTVAPSALTIKSATDVIDKYKKNIIELPSGIKMHADGAAIEEPYHKAIDEYITSNFPTATNVTVDPSYVSIDDNMGVTSKIPKATWDDHLSFIKADLERKTIADANKPLNVAKKIGTNILEEAYNALPTINEGIASSDFGKYLNTINTIKEQKSLKVQRTANEEIAINLKRYTDMSKDTTLSDYIRQEAFQKTIELNNMLNKS
jgi:hypothetical protein